MTWALPSGPPRPSQRVRLLDADRQRSPKRLAGPRRPRRGDRFRPEWVTGFTGIRSPGPSRSAHQGSPLPPGAKSLVPASRLAPLCEETEKGARCDGESPGGFACRQLCALGGVAHNRDVPVAFRDDLNVDGVVPHVVAVCGALAANGQPVDGSFTERRRSVVVIDPDDEVPGLT